MAKIIANWVMVPDGTMLPSMNRHDCREHISVDKIERYHPEGVEEPDHSDIQAWIEWNSQTKTRILESRRTIIDGGTSYLRRGGDYTEMSIYDDDPFIVIRRFLCRDNRGKDGKQPLTYVPLCKMSDAWLEAIISYIQHIEPNNAHIQYYEMELQYRKENNIQIDEFN